MLYISSRYMLQRILQKVTDEFRVALERVSIGQRRESVHVRSHRLSYSLRETHAEIVRTIVSP